MADLENWKLEHIERELTAQGTKITKLEKEVNLLVTASEVRGVHQQNVETRLTQIEDTLKWLVRVIIGTILLALIKLLIDKGGSL